MRRALAILLLAAIHVPLIAPLALADSESSLPACCRKNGAHHCSMKTGPADELGFGAVREQCTQCPISIAAQTNDSVALIEHPQIFQGTFAVHSTIRWNDDPLSRLWVSRSHQKRGPPADIA